jgi:hypothetical protein
MIMETTEPAEQWLYRLDEQIFGPVATHVLSERILSGTISPEIHVACNQGEFHHITRVTAFREILEKRHVSLATRRKSVEKIRLILSVVLLAVGAGGAFIIVDTQAAAVELEQQIQRDQILEQRRMQVQANKAMPLPMLEPLVTAQMLDAAQLESDEREAEKLKTKTVKVRKNRARTKRMTSAQISDSCQLKQQDVMRVMKRHIGSITHCVSKEQTRASATGSTMPDKLDLGFIVRATGQVIQFELEHPNYRRGLLHKCLKKAFKKVVFPKRGGTDCPTSLPIRIPK